MWNDSDYRKQASLHLLVTDPGRELHYQPVFEYLHKKEVSFTKVYPNDKNSGIYVDLGLTSCEFNTFSALLISECRSQGIPTLHIVDGITEWRNTWENPRSESEERGMPMFQPILSDKIACIGASQGRLFCSWGQAGKVEVTGLPRLDSLVTTKSKLPEKAPKSHAPLKVVIATAKTPGFTKRQLQAVREGLADINDYINNSDLSDALVVWRAGVPDVLPPNCLGISSRTSEESSMQVLEGASMVITTPSTFALEAMALEIPTCIIDYTNSPPYLLSAWRITAREQIKAEIKSLTARDPARMTYQNYLAHDQIRLDSPAAPRVAELALRMAGIGRDARKKGVSPLFSSNMMSGYDYIQSAAWDPSVLFPAHPVFVRGCFDEINAEVGHLRLELNRLRKYSHSLEVEIEAMRLRQRLKRLASKLLKGFD